MLKRLQEKKSNYDYESWKQGESERQKHLRRMTTVKGASSGVRLKSSDEMNRNLEEFNGGTYGSSEFLLAAYYMADKQPNFETAPQAQRTASVRRRDLERQL